ncbi:MAG: hypothetical protein JO154_06365 [Chitinophaga sp.]|uniref:hypothetical protein n=1 Tax=Chitinophaga sp. TaxID=1869181 RepID=UPI0025BE1E5E|nr:hypothetical protein [Chitinophaga sp.]MBV8252216.1 hypothetical protein [Chitinophaga sp.]
MTIKVGPYVYDWKEIPLVIALIVLFIVFPFSTGLWIAAFLIGGWLFWRLREMRIVTVIIDDHQLELQYVNCLKMGKVASYYVPDLKFVVKEVVVKRGEVSNRTLIIYTDEDEIATFVDRRHNWDWERIEEIMVGLKKAGARGLFYN